MIERKISTKNRVTCLADVQNFIGYIYKSVFNCPKRFEKELRDNSEGSKAERRFKGHETLIRNQHQKPVPENRFRFLTRLTCNIAPNFSGISFW